MVIYGGRWRLVLNNDIDGGVEINVLKIRSELMCIGKSKVCSADAKKKSQKSFHILQSAGCSM